MSLLDDSNMDKSDFEAVESLRPLPPAPVAWLFVAAISGIFLGANLDAPGVVGLGFLALLVALKCVKRPLVWAILFLIGGFCVFWIYSDLRLSRKDSLELHAPREISAVIKVEELFYTRGRRCSGIGRVVQSHSLLALAGERVFFNVWSEIPVEEVLPLARLHMRGRLMLLADDESGFESWLRSQDVRIRLDKADIEGVAKGAPSIERFRASTFNRLKDSLYRGAKSDRERHASDVMAAMITGDKSGISRDVREGYRVTGTMHLFAVSGLHIGILSMAILQGIGLTRMPRVAVHGMTLVAVALFVWIIGSPPSAVRALLMLTVWFSAQWFCRQPNSGSAVFAAATLLLVVDPSNLRNPGFQLSVGIVTALIAYGEPLSQALRYYANQRLLAHKVPLWVARLVGNTFTAFLFSTPLAIQYFGFASPVSLIVNLFAVPAAVPLIVMAATSAFAGTLALPLFPEIINWVTRQGIHWLERMILAFQNFPLGHASLTFREEGFGSVLVLLMIGATLAAHSLNCSAKFRLMLAPVVLIAGVFLGIEIDLPQGADPS